GMATQGAKVIEFKPELTRSQTKLLFALANDAAEAFYTKIPESDLNEANQFLGRDWNKDDLHPIEIRASHHPLGHERHVSRLLFVQDTDGEYKEFAMLETRTGQLPIGTKAQANFI
ncbi:MAG: hypothetical protein ACYT04_84210, partial [Nostoc sp.]